MTQTAIKQESKDVTNTMINEESKEVYISDILQAIQGIPKQHWLNLLKIIQAFQSSTNNEQEIISQATISTEKEIDKVEKINRNQAILDLLNRWEKEGDVKEQTETLNYLLEVLD
ncbi:hypothetical protein [Geminocystis herdmanii]|uniref:hypothetical protein n=1 Tax=Geminocystis herdmanii TaxID=669359 RepID=UPI00034CAFD9|nr:hypothetical protein [Geminocystis herdmanii]